MTKASEEICSRKLYDQDDGEVTYCQLPQGHKGEHNPWPDLHINKPVEHIPTKPSEPTQAKTQSEIDVSNLRFYARLFREHKWELREMSWTVFEQTLNEVAERIAQQDVKLQEVTRERETLKRYTNPNTLRRMFLRGELEWGTGIPQWPNETLKSTLQWAKDAQEYVAASRRAPESREGKE
jgi:hypothetical protein